MESRKSFIGVLMVTQLCQLISGHGMMIDPLARNSAMKMQEKLKFSRKCNIGPTNYNLAANFCGGKQTQTENSGKCSACGDNYAATYPRDHDLGGTFVTEMTPSRLYLQGDIITVVVEITAQHKGYFEFRLCDKLEQENGDDELTKCLNDETQYRLLETTEGHTKYQGLLNYGEHLVPVKCIYPTPGDIGCCPFCGITQSKIYYIDLQLPADVNCYKGCSLQWWYRTGNSWGCDTDGTCATGKGPQEHFVNCADIVILNCDQYLRGNYPDWCGYGPTQNLSACGATEKQSSDDASTGITMVEDSDIDELDEPPAKPSSSWESDNNQKPEIGKQEASEANSQQTGGGGDVADSPNKDVKPEEQGGYDADWYPQLPSGSSNNKPSITCQACYGRGDANCDACCSPYMTTTYRGTTNTFNQWCNDNCPRFCPESYCTRTVVRHFKKLCPLIDNGNFKEAPSCETCQRERREYCENHCCEKVVSRIYKGLSSSRFDSYCQNNCARGHCPQSYCVLVEDDGWKDICKVGYRHLKEVLRSIVNEAKKENTDE